MPAQNLPFLPPSPFQWRPNRETETALSRVPPHFPHRSAAPREGAIMASRFLFSLPSPQPRRRLRRRSLESIPFPSVRRRLKEGRRERRVFSVQLRTKGAERANISGRRWRKKKKWPHSGRNFNCDASARKIFMVQLDPSRAAAAGKVVTVKGAVSGLPRRVLLFFPR